MKRSNTRLADVNEIYCTFLLNNRQFPDPATEREFKRKVTLLSDKEIAEQTGRARVMVKEFLRIAGAKGYQFPKAVYWTARPGFNFQQLLGVKINQNKFPADILVEFRGGGFLGFSAKSTTSGDVGFKNPGMGTVDRELGINNTDYVTKQEQVIRNVYKDFGRLSNELRSNQMRKWKEAADPKFLDISRRGSKVETYCRNRLLTRLNQMVTQEERRDYIIGSWLDATDAYPPYLKVTGNGTAEEVQLPIPLPPVPLAQQILNLVFPPGWGGRFTATVYDPMQNSKMDALNTKKITFTKAGSNSIAVKAGQKPLFNMRYKFSGYKFASSMKLSGDPR